MVPERKCDQNFVKDGEIHGESNVWSAAQRQKNIWAFDADLIESIDQFAMKNSVDWYGHALRREDAHVSRRALDIVVEGQREAEEDMEQAG